MAVRVGVIFGGRSGEHEISIRSAQSVIWSIDREKFEMFPVCVTKDGKWLDPSASCVVLGADFAALASPEIENIPSGEVALWRESGNCGLISLGSVGSAITKLDVVFPVLHGTYGEDGTIQGLFEMVDIPYVGCGVLASSCGMDKVLMKILLRDAGLPICKYTWFSRKELENNPDNLIRRLKTEIGYPMFVKPANLGSSVGVSKGVDQATLRKAVEYAAEFDGKIVVEECLEMREIECGVIGNDSPEASSPGEYIIRDRQNAFLDYTEKYSATGNNEFVVPSPISDELCRKVREMSVKTFRAIDGSGLARVDFFLRRDTGELLVNEINTMPGLTEASGFPKMWAGSGMSFSEVIEKLIDLAFERHGDKARNKTSFNV